MKHLDHRHRLRRARHRRLPGRARPRRHLRRRRPRARSPRSTRGRAPILRGGPARAAAARTSARRCRRRPTSRAAVRDSRHHAHRRRHAGVDGQHRPRVCRRAPPSEIGAALARQDRLPHRGRQEHGGPGHDRRRRARRAREAPRASRPGADFGLGMNPEFLTEGKAVADFMHPDRIVLGGIDERTHDALASALRGLRRDVPRIRTNNAHRGDDQVRVELAARHADLVLERDRATCARAVGDIDVARRHARRARSRPTSRRGATASARQGRRSRAFLEAGCGFGGSCLPKDVTALAAQGRSARRWRCRMLASVLDINRSQPEELLRLVAQALPDLARRAASPCSASRSSRTPTTCASRRRFRILRALRGARCTADRLRSGRLAGGPRVGPRRAPRHIAARRAQCG